MKLRFPLAIICTLILSGCTLFPNSDTATDTFAQFLVLRPQISSHQINMTFTNDTSYELVYQRDRDGDIQTIYSGESTTNNRYINESIYYQEPKGGQWYQLTLGKIDPAKDAGLWDILSWDKAQLEAAEVTYISQAQCLDSTCDLYQITRDSITLNLALDTQTFRPVKASYRHNNIDVEFIYTFPHLEINSPENPELLEFPVDPTDLDMDILNTIYGDEPDN